MKKTPLFFCFFFCISVLSCSQNNKDSADNKPALPKDRNMFGLGIPRGLTLSTNGLADGYILFPVPNSASVYLINRKGEVVHEWKGNYGSLAAATYLENDGSIIQNAADPDFPVFAGCGEAGRNVGVRGEVGRKSFVDDLRRLAKHLELVVGNQTAFVG